MKLRILSTAYLSLPLATALAALLAAPSAQATIYYWDVDGPGTAGFGTVVGAWDGIITFWNTDSTGGAGGSAIAAPFITDDLNFVAATTNTGSVALSTTQNAQSLTYGSTVGAITLSGAGTLNLAPAATITTNSVAATIHSIASTISGAGTSLTKAGVGTLYLTHTTNTFNPGEIILSGGILRIGNNTATTLNSGSYSGNISISSGAVFQIYSTSVQTLSGIISGAGNFTKMGGGALTLGNANTYTGKTLFSPILSGAGFTVNVSSFDYVTSGTWANHGLGSSLGAPTTAVNGTIDLSAAGQGSVNLTYTGAAALGETTDRGIFLGFNGSAGHTITANNASGTLRFTSAFTSNATGSGQLTLTGTGLGQIDQGLPQISSGGLNKNGTGTWTLGGSGSFTGATVITDGTLSLSSATALQNSAFNTTTSVAGGSGDGLKIATTTLTLGGLTGANALASRCTTTAGGYSGLTALTLNTVAGSNSSYSGAIDNGATGMSLIKTGTGTQTLTGVNGYTGTTSIDRGTLFLNSPGSLATSAATVATGATLAGNGTIAGTVNISAGGRLSPGATVGTIGTLTLSNNTGSALTLNGINLFSDLPATGTTADLVAITGDLVLNGTNTVTLSALPAAGVAASTNIDLMTYANKTGSGSLVFVNGLSTLGSLTLVANATGNAQLQVGAGGLNHSVWKGDTDSVWDTATTNWTRNGTATQAFVAGDFVTFDDTALAGRYTVTGAGSASQVTVNNSTNAYIINANISGTDTPLIKNGTNSLTLGGTNTYSGGTILNAGTLTANADVNLGAATGGITFAGNSTLAMTGTINHTRQITLNGGVTGTILSGAGVNYNNSAKVTGAGDLVFTLTGNGGRNLRFNSTSNDFTGTVKVDNASGQQLAVFFNSLVDTSVLGTGNIILTLSGANGPNTFSYGSGAIAPLALTNRRLELAGSGTINAIFSNQNTTQAITIGSDLLISSTGNKGLTLDAVAGPANVFSGNIANGSFGGATQVVSIAKSGAGTWRIGGNLRNTGGITINAGGALTLSGTNIYSGNTNFSGVGALLTLAGSQAASANTTFLMNTNASSASSTIKLLDDTGNVNDGTATFAGTYRLQSNNTPGATNTFFVGNNSAANGGTGSGTTTGSTVVIGTMNWNTVATTTTNVGNIDITGANTYRLQINNVVLFNGSGHTVGSANNTNFNPTTANVTLGAVTQAAGNAVNGVIPTLVLGGTSTDNRVTGIISDASDAGTSLRPVNVIKNNSGTWTLSGNNTYDGLTTVANNGTLILSGDNLGAAGGVTLSTNTSVVPKLHINSATALGTGTLNFGGGGASDTVQIDNSSMAAVSVTTSNVFTLNRNFTFIGTQSLNLGNMTTTIGPATLVGNRSITVTDKTLTFGGSIGEAVANLGVIKNGAGTLILNGTNTYTGATTVNAGTLGGIGTFAGAVTVAADGSLAPGASAGASVGPLTTTSSLDISAMAGITGTGKLKFDLGSVAASDKLAVTGTVAIGTEVLAFNDFAFNALSGLQNGTYKLVTSGGGITGTLDLVSANLTGAVGSGTGTLKITGNDLELVVSGVTGLAGYNLWASTNASTTTPAQDQDGDGVSNAVEYVLGGSSGTNDLAKLPAASVVGGNLLFTFQRSQASIDGSTVAVIEVGTDLTAWPAPSPYAIPDLAATNIPGVSVQKGVPTGFDTITLNLPQGTDLKKFARLKVTITP